MERVCFTVIIPENQIDEYRRRHAEVWPELLSEIQAAGRRNYSLFLRNDGLLIGYYETDDDRASARELARGPVSARWELFMSDIFRSQGRIDRTAPRVPEVFNLEEQLTKGAGQ